jgi:hypothetical protein
MTRLHIKRHDDGWWIAGLGPEHGPYNTRAEADEDRKGLENFYERWREIKERPLFAGNEA